MTDAGPLDGATPALVVALVVRFALELALLAGVAVATWLLVPGWWRWPAAIVAVIAVAVLWGAMLSPRAPVTIDEWAKVAIEVVLFGGTALALAATGLGIPAAVGVAVWLVDRVAIAMLQR